MSEADTIVPQSKPSSRAWWLKQLYQWHWISSAISLIGLILFAITGFTLNHAGTKTVEGVTADKFTGTADQKNGKLVLFASGNTLRVGDVDGSLDAEGYANAFFDSRYTLKRLD